MVNYDELIEKYFKNYDNLTWHDAIRVMDVINCEYNDKIKSYEDKIKELGDERDELLSNLKQLMKEVNMGND